jgi:hypothetical protein
MLSSKRLVRLFGPNVTVASLGAVMLTLADLFLRHKVVDPVLGGFLGSLFAVLGIQMILWSLGIRTELFGTSTRETLPALAAKYNRADHIPVRESRGEDDFDLQKRTHLRRRELDLQMDEAEWLDYVKDRDLGL